MMKRFVLVLIIALGTSYACQAEPDTAAIEKFAQKIMHMDRDILTCERNIELDELAVYYSKDYMKRVNKICGKENREHYRYIALIDLDGASPILCHDDANAVAPCFRKYVIEDLKVQGNRADVKITYGHENEAPVIYYTVLRLIHEDGRWKIDDVSLIDPNAIEGYDESVYSFKEQIDNETAFIDKQKKEDSTNQQVKPANPTP